MTETQVKRRSSRFRMLSRGLAILAAALFLTQATPSAWAKSIADIAGYGASDLVTMRATVTALDMTNKTITLTGPDGGQVTMTYGKNIANADKIKVGDPVIAQYYEAVTYVLSPPNAKIPDDALAAATAATPPGGLPVDAAAVRLTVTGLVVGVNKSAHTISVVDPDGGQVRTLNVKSKEGMDVLKSVKVGDTITAYINEAVAVGIEPATK